jgi:hypothetical protein
VTTGKALPIRRYEETIRDLTLYKYGKGQKCGVQSLNPKYMQDAMMFYIEVVILSSVNEIGKHV